MRPFSALSPRESLKDKLLEKSMYLSFLPPISRKVIEPRLETFLEVFRLWTSPLELFIVEPSLDVTDDDELNELFFEYVNLGSSLTLRRPFSFLNSPLAETEFENCLPEFSDAVSKSPWS